MQTTDTELIKIVYKDWACKMEPKARCHLMGPFYAIFLVAEIQVNILTERKLVSA